MHYLSSRIVDLLHTLVELSDLKPNWNREIIMFSFEE